MNNQYFLGLSYSHNQSACLIKDDKILVAIQNERITRVKDDGHDMATSREEAIRYCLDYAGITIDDVDLCVYNIAQGLPDLERTNNLPFLDFPDDFGGHLLEQLPPERRRWISHHLGHAYAGLAMVDWTDAAVMVIDGCARATDLTEDLAAAGIYPEQSAAREQEHASFYLWRDGTLDCLAKCFWPDGLVGAGETYERAAAIVFSDPLQGCGKLMGLAPYGDALAYAPTILQHEPNSPHWYGKADWLNEYLAEQRRTQLVPGASKLPRLHENLAAKIQQELEQALIAQASWLYEQTGAKKLIISGGVGLNSVANKKILDQTPFEEIFIVPAASDAGIAIGCAYYAYQRATAGSDRRWQRPTGDFFGRPYTAEEIRTAIDERAQPAVITSTELELDELIVKAATALKDRKIIAWFQGGSELGPRALGHRSILTCATDPAMKATLNERVKHREGFRPFAASVLAEHVGTYFELDCPSPFMLLVAKGREARSAEIPAVMHVDGTTRLQTVTPDDDLRYHALLSEYYRQTGVPLFLNTSFNVMGEPLVETPADALRCFLTTGIDVLIMEHFWIEKRGLSFDEIADLVPQIAGNLTVDYTYTTGDGGGLTLKQIRYTSGDLSTLITPKVLLHLGNPDQKLALIKQIFEQIDGVRSFGRIADVLGLGAEQRDVFVLCAQELVYRQMISCQVA